MLTKIYYGQKVTSELLDKLEKEFRELVDGYENMAEAARHTDEDVSVIRRRYELLKKHKRLKDLTFKQGRPYFNPTKSKSPVVQWAWQKQLGMHQGETQKEAAKRLGVSRQAVSYARRMVRRWVRNNLDI